MEEIINKLSEATKVLKQENEKYKKREETKRYYIEILESYNKYFKEKENIDIKNEDMDLHYILDKAIDVIDELENKIEDLKLDISDLNRQISDLWYDNKPDEYPRDLD